jgi:uncharacterized iron-regulated membrane protein
VNSWQRWWQAPHTHWLRRALFQLHLWLGIGFGLYILVISVSGSAIVLRPWIHRWLVQDPAEAFAPWLVRAVEWLTLLHDELFLERSGRTLNGIGGLVFLLLVFSGVVLWWQGRRRWHEGLHVRADSARSLLWQLHSFAGFWAFLLFFAWGITAVYFAWPLPFDLLMDRFDADLLDAERPDGFLLLLIDLHFGRFRGTLWAAWLWTVLGLLPAFMYISGFVLWYRRVLQRRLAR